MKCYKAEKSELIKFAQEVDMYAESFYPLYAALEESVQTSEANLCANKKRMNAYMDYLYIEGNFVLRLHGLCEFFCAGPHLMRRIKEIKVPSDIDTFLRDQETTTFHREISELLNAIRSYI